MVKVVDFIQQSIIYIYTILVGITLFSAIQLNQYIFDATGLSVAIIIGVAIVITLIFKIEYLHKNVKNFFNKYAFSIAVILFCLAIIWQFVISISSSTPIGFDVDRIFGTAKNPEAAGDYFSNYPNNLALLLVFRKIELMGLLTWKGLALITAVLVSLSAILNLVTVYFIDKKKITALMYIESFWLIFYPMVIVPYSDSWVLPLVSLYLLGYFGARSVKNYFFKILLAIVMGCNVVLAYYIKPSSIIPIIAIAIIYFLNLLKNKFRISPVKLITVLMFFGTLFCTSTLVKNVQNNQEFIQVDNRKAFPPLHFIAMGLSENGGFYVDDVLDMQSAKNVNERKKISLEKIKNRFVERGVLGYIKFIYRKHTLNTADGSFGWLKEGNFIVANAKNSGISGMIQNFIYPDGKHLGDFFLLAQLWWCMWLSLLAFGYKEKSKSANILRLAVIGGMAFLLIFEGGRSRYLIQFIPVLLILATLLSSSSIITIKRIIKSLC